MSLNRYMNNDFDEVASACNHDHDCDSESAQALKRILSLVDDLNSQDLRILEDVIERLICDRRK